MPRVFATVQDYRNWSGDQAAQLSPAQLQEASLLVAGATAGACYDTYTDTLLPTDSAVAVALRDATCAVLKFRDDTGTSGALAAAGLKSAKIGTATYEVADDSGGVDTRGLPWLAHQILSEAGLVGGPVIVYG